MCSWCTTSDQSYTDTLLEILLKNNQALNLNVKKCKLWGKMWIEANQPSHPEPPEFWQWQDRGVQRSLSQLMWVSFKMPGKWLCWPHPHSEILFWELLTELQPKEQELTHLYSTQALHSHTQMCARGTRGQGWSRQSSRWISETPAWDSALTHQCSAWRWAHTHLYLCSLPLTVSLSSTTPASEHKFMHTTEGCKLSSRPWAVRCILLFATQTGHEQRDQDK